MDILLTGLTYKDLILDIMQVDGSVWVNPVRP